MEYLSIRYGFCSIGIPFPKRSFKILFSRTQLLEFLLYKMGFLPNYKFMSVDEKQWFSMVYFTRIIEYFTNNVLISCDS